MDAVLFIYPTIYLSCRLVLYFERSSKDNTVFWRCPLLEALSKFDLKTKIKIRVDAKIKIMNNKEGCHRREQSIFLFLFFCMRQNPYLSSKHIRYYGCFNCVYGCMHGHVCVVGINCPTFYCTLFFILLAFLGIWTDNFVPERIKN